MTNEKRKYKKNGKRDVSGRIRRSQIGTVYQKKSGLYMAKVPIQCNKIGEKRKQMPDGSVKTIPKYKYDYLCKSTGTKDYGEAIRFLHALTAEYGLHDEAKIIDRLLEKKGSIEYEIQKRDVAKKKEEEARLAAEPAMNLQEAFLYYKNSQKRPDSGERTLSDYEGQYGRFVDWVKQNHPDVKEIRYVDSTVAEGFSKHLKGTASAGTHNHYIIFLRMFWKTIMQIPYAKARENPWIGIRSKTLDYVVKQNFSIEQLERFIPLLPDDYKCLQLSVFILEPD